MSFWSLGVSLAIIPYVLIFISVNSFFERVCTKLMHTKKPISKLFVYHFQIDEYSLSYSDKDNVSKI